MAGEAPARRPSVIVVGGSTMDVVATPAREHPLRRGSSVPGTVQQVPGGVGRNIAEAAARILDSSSSPSSAVALVSVVGRDAAGAALLASCASLPALDCSGVITAPPGARTPTVVAVLDPSGGELAACVADATATETHLSPEAVAREVGRRLVAPPSSPPPSSSSLSSPAAPAVAVLDGNLSPEAVLAGAVAVAAAAAAAAAGAEPPPCSLFEPVSAVKAARGAAALPWLCYASPNAGELSALARAIPAGRELRRRLMNGHQRGNGAGLPTMLPLPAAAAAARGRWLDRARRRSPGAPPPPSPPDAVMQQLHKALPEAVAVLNEGLGCLILTLGELGAALLTLHRSSAAAAAAAAARSGDAADASSSSSSSAVVLVRHVPAVPGVRPISTSGAGDCLVAGFAVALSGGADDDAANADAEVDALAIGAAAAAAAVASANNVPNEEGALDLGGRLAPLARDLARRVSVAVLPAPQRGPPQSRL